MENSELTFTEEALEAIAERAMVKDTGARGLRSIIEEVMLDIMFDLPDLGPGEYVVDREIVDGGQQLMPITKKSA